VFVICRKIQIVGLVARNLDYVHVASSKLHLKPASANY
jgi:hypothetical protein